MSTRNTSWGGKGSRCAGLTTLPTQPSGTLRSYTELLYLLPEISVWRITNGLKCFSLCFLSSRYAQSCSEPLAVWAHLRACVVKYTSRGNPALGQQETLVTSLNALQIWAPATLGRLPHIGIAASECYTVEIRSAALVARITLLEHVRHGTSRFGRTIAAAAATWHELGEWVWPQEQSKGSHQFILLVGVQAGGRYTRSVNKVMRLIQYNSVLTFKLQIEYVPFKIVPLGGYTPPETLFPLFVATLVVANRNRF